MGAASQPHIIEKLTQDHDLSELDCGNPQLNNWLKRFAWTNQRAETAKTYVAHLQNRVAGYHALAAGSVLKHEAPERIAHGIANHPVGLILLARLPLTRPKKARDSAKPCFATRSRAPLKQPMSSECG